MLIFLAFSFWHILVSCMWLSHFQVLLFKYIYGAKCLIYIHLCAGKQCKIDNPVPGTRPLGLLFMKVGFRSTEHRSPRDTQLPFDMLFITIFYTCHVTEVVYHMREQLRIRKSLKLYIFLYRNAMKDIKISLNKVWYTYTALIPTNMMFSSTQ